MHNLVQGTPEWLEFRRSRIMASDAPIIMGGSPWSTPLELYWSKINRTEKEVTPSMKRGSDLEEEARDLFIQKTGYFVLPAVLTHPVDSWMGASLDGYNEEEGIVVEIKCPNIQDHLYAVDGTLPYKYYAQLQHQMYVARVTSAYYVSYHPKAEVPFSCLLVERDGTYVTEMIKREKQFYECLVNRTPPEPLISDINKYNKLMEFDVLFVDADKEMRLVELMDQWEAAKEIKKELDELKKSITDSCEDKNRIGLYLKYKISHCPGPIDYSAIPELKGVDLEKYRKPPIKKWILETI